MRPEQDREIDSLLREHARRGRVPPAGVGVEPSAGGDGGAAHLDADELSAFAENALPAASRTRYVAHLADCDRCRKLAAQLTISAGVAEELERRESRVASVAAIASGAAVAPDASWSAWLSGLFSSRVLRYAIPLVALVAVSAAALLVLTGGRRSGALGDLARGENVAQKAQPGLHHQPAAQPQGATTGATPQDGAAGGLVKVDDDTQAGQSPRTEQSEEKAGGTQSRPASDASGEPYALKDAQEGATARPAQTFAPEVVAVAPPAPAPASAAPGNRATSLELPSPVPPLAEDEQQRRQADAKEKGREEAARLAAIGKQREHGPRRNNDQVFNNQIGNSSNRDSADRNSPRDSERRADKGESASAPKQEGDERAQAKRAPAARGRMTDGRASAQSAREGAKTQRGMTADGVDAGAETRSVAGRRFRRQGDAWIDTAYNSSRATVQLRRGSEQFRALVADEPEIARIASALPGEVLVVWKGRAYRIR